MDYFQYTLTEGIQRIIAQSSQVISDFDVSYQRKEILCDITISGTSNEEDKHTSLDYDIVDKRDIRLRKSFSSTTRHSTITSEDLSERLRILYKQAEMILKITTRRLKRSVILHLSRRY